MVPQGIQFGFGQLGPPSQDRHARLSLNCSAAKAGKQGSGRTSPRYGSTSTPWEPLAGSAACAPFGLAGRDICHAAGETGGKVSERTQRNVLGSTPRACLHGTPLCTRPSRTGAQFPSQPRPPVPSNRCTPALAALRLQLLPPRPAAPAALPSLRLPRRAAAGPAGPSAAGWGRRKPPSSCSGGRCCKGCPDLRTEQGPLGRNGVSRNAGLHMQRPRPLQPLALRCLLASPGTSRPHPGHSTGRT